MKLIKTRSVAPLLGALAGILAVSYVGVALMLPAQQPPPKPQSPEELKLQIAEQQLKIAQLQEQVDRLTLLNQQLQVALNTVVNDSTMGDEKAVQDAQAALDKLKKEQQKDKDKK
jgi:hypothetical protein